MKLKIKLSIKSEKENCICFANENIKLNFANLDDNHEKWMKYNNYITSTTPKTKQRNVFTSNGSIKLEHLLSFLTVSLLNTAGGSFPADRREKGFFRNWFGWEGNKGDNVSERPLNSRRPALWIAFKKSWQPEWRLRVAHILSTKS